MSNLIAILRFQHEGSIIIEFFLYYNTAIRYSRIANGGVDG
jgi:hypothetical protein